MPRAPLDAAQGALPNTLISSDKPPAMAYPIIGSPAGTNPRASLAPGGTTSTIKSTYMANMSYGGILAAPSLASGLCASLL